VLVKIYGNKPKKLLYKINLNKEIKIKVLPLWPVEPSKVLNSLCRVNKILFQIMWYRDGINQKEQGINNNPKNVLNQFNDKLKIVVEGSNTENKLVIIFNLRNLF
jgi:hypothetical protein